MELNIQNHPVHISNASLTKKVADDSNALQITERFSDMLSDAIRTMNAQQNDVHQLNEQFIRGELTDPHELLIASQKAALGLELTVQLRNKVVEAYQEVMRMQI